MTENQELQTNIELNEEQKKYIEKASNRYYNKNKREIDRLSEHAKTCLITGNQHGYKYSIEKLRVLCNKPKLDKDILHSMWVTSKSQTDEIIFNALGA